MPEDTQATQDARENGAGAFRVNEQQAETLVTMANMASTLMEERREFARRAGLLNQGDRDLYKTYGWDREPEFDDYLAKYKRMGVARRIVEAPAKATWRHRPEVSDNATEEGDDPTQFEQDWENLVQRHRPFHHLERADRLAGIYYYSIIVLGVESEKPLSEELGDDEDLAYHGVYRYDHVEISEWEENPRSSRFGQPTEYEVKLVDEDDDSDFNPENDTVDVHWSRVIHVAPDRDEDEVNSTPRLQPVYNLLDDWLKVVGGAPEMFWQDAASIYHADVDKDADLPPDGEKGSLSDMEDQFQAALRRFKRFVGTKGVDFKIMRGDAPKPKETVEALKVALAAGKAMPIRVLFGSERGELASQEDKGEWLARMAERQTVIAGPLMLRPYIDRLVKHGMISEPEGDGYSLEWPNLFELDEVEESEVRANNAKALQAVASAIASGGISQDAPILERLGLDGLRPEDMDQFIDDEDAATQGELEGIEDGEGEGGG